MTKTEALVQIIGQANQANNKIIYDYLLSEVESIMNQIRDEQVKYCDFCSHAHRKARAQEQKTPLIARF